MNPDKTDAEKRKEYTRTGYRKTYVYEKAHYFSLLRRGISAKINNKRVVVREGDRPHDMGRVVTITNHQKLVYDLLVNYLKTYNADFVFYKVLTGMGIREKTLKTLERLKLIQIDDNKVRLWVEVEVDPFMENAIKK